MGMEAGQRWKADVPLSVRMLTVSIAHLVYIQHRHISVTHEPDEIKNDMIYTTRTHQPQLEPCIQLRGKPPVFSR